MDKEVAKLNKANIELVKELAAARSTASTWEKRALTAEAQAEKDREASDGIIREHASRHKKLEETIFKYCRQILGEYLCVNLILHQVPE
jgi:hypothetical protein